jgi:hypothetical protein
MLALVLPLLLQVSAASGPSADPQETPAQPAAAAAQQPPTKSEEPKVVCKTIKVTGSRVRKRTICNSEGVKEADEMQRDGFRDFINRSGNKYYKSN